MRTRTGKASHGMSAKRENADKNWESKPWHVHKKGKCGQELGKQAMACPQKGKMRTRTGKASHGMSANRKNADSKFRNYHVHVR
ncbi:hypothetical protein ACNQFZ_19715 [Schinkia sp. CFF1]